MKKVNLTKYGFIRWPEEDFSDDGNRFTCYRAGKAVRVSKLVSDGQIYLSIDSECGNGTLPYEVYSKLPYYKEATWSYNGVSVEDLTEEDIQTFYEACISYEQAYLKEEANIKYPTLDEIKEQCKKIMIKTMKELDEIENILTRDRLVEVAIKFSEYDWRELQRGLNQLTGKMASIGKDYPAKIYKTAYSFNFVRPDNNDLTTPNYWYQDIMNKFKKYKII